MESNIDSSMSSITASTSTITSPPVSSASSFVNVFVNEINNQDVQGLLNVQCSMLEQLDKTNEKLDGINKLSAKRYLDATRDFYSHAQMLTTMKTDLDLIFKRIKLLKTRLNKKYPESYASVVRMSVNQNNSSMDDEDDDSNTADLTSSIKPATSATLVKSKTIDASQFSSSMHESHSFSQLASSSGGEQTPSSFGAVRRFVLDKSPGGQDFTTLFKSARDEFRKINEGLLGGSGGHQKSPPPPPTEQ